MPNPYTLVFGQPPLEMISRSAQATRILYDFSQKRPVNSINLITGIRGSGKTVFITQIAKTLSEKKEWIVVNLNAQRDLLVSLASKLNSNRNLSRLFREAEINLQAFGFGVSIKGVPPVTDIEEALSRMLRVLREHGKRVLVTIDEVTNSKEMRIFASAYQIFLREELPVFLLMTGLYKQIDNLRNAEGMTFLERAPRTVLAPLDLYAMAKKYEETLSLRADAAMKLASATRGYSFAFQVMGFFYYENPDNPEKAREEALDYLCEFAYRKIWSEMSGKDREVAAAIGRVPDGSVEKIRQILMYSSNQFNPYRDRLIKAGIITGEQTGIVAFALPGFGEFAQKMLAEIYA